jgi:hypothetical protein
VTALETLGLALGTSFASGLNLYATVAALGLLHRFDVFHLPSSLEVLANPWVIGFAVALYLIEFTADKIPYVDNVWDTVHTFIRPAAAAVLAYGAFTEMPDFARVIAALLMGGIALTSHSSKASTRAAVNASPEPISNWILSLFEDGVAFVLTWLAVTHPILTVGVVVVLLVISAYIIVKLFGFLRRAWNRRSQDAPDPDRRLASTQIGR